jgi:hypothetical protein
LADGVIPNEYGINPKHKLVIGAKVLLLIKYIISGTFGCIWRAGYIHEYPSEKSRGILHLLLGVRSLPLSEE